MSDEPTDDATEAPATEETTDETTSPAGSEETDADNDDSGGNEKTYTAADLERVVEQRLGRERAKLNADLDKLKAKAKALQDAMDSDKGELQTALERAEQAEKRAAEAERSALRNKVAATRGVPAAALIGETEEELSASADELIAWRDQNKQQTSKRPTASAGLKSGATGRENDNLDPKAKAADALRRLRNET